VLILNTPLDNPFKLVTLEGTQGEHKLNIKNRDFWDKKPFSLNSSVLVNTANMSQDMTPVL